MAFALALLAGCATTPWNLPSSSRLDSATSDTKVTSHQQPKSSGSHTDAQSLQEVMSELQQFMALDPAAQDRLMADLKEVDPSLQPIFLQTFLAEAAYKRREEQREAEKQNQTTAASVALREDPGAKTAGAGEQETRLDLKSRAEQASPAPLPKGEGSESMAALAPQPSANSIASMDNGLALSPEPSVMGGIEASSTGTTPTEPLSVAARLAAIRAEASTGAVVPDAPAPLSESDWQAHLAAAIRSIQQSDTGHRAAETKRILGETVAQLSEAAPLAVRNLTFCTEVARFGSFEALKNTEFTPGQKVLLYAEVDNLHVESSAKGYHWAVNVRGQIFDSRGNRLADYGSTSAEEYYQTPRHDFFVSKLYYLPRLAPGRYSLQLAIEDTLGRKAGQSSIDFTVKAARISTEK